MTPMNRVGLHSSFYRVLMAAMFLVPGVVGATDLVLHLPFDDGQGSAIAADVSGNGHDGTLVNMDSNTDWVTGKAGLALDFDGTNDYVVVPDDAALDFGTSDYSVAFWVFKRTPTVGYDNNYGVSKWRTAANPGTNEWHVNVGSGLATGDTPASNLEVGSSYGKVIDPSEITLHEWHHIAAVRESTTLSLYVDGVFVDANSSIPVGGVVNNTGCELRIAVNQPAAPLFYTDAIFDDVQIYDFALSDGDVATGQPAGGDIAFLYANPGAVVTIFSDGFESGDTSGW